MNRKRVGIFLLVVLVAVSTGCTSPQEYFYTLSPNAASGTSPRSTGIFTAGPPSIAVGPVSLPESVDRPQIVVRSGANQVKVTEQRRWASPLDSQIPRVIVENLTGMFGNRLISCYEQNIGPRADLQVVVDVLRFDTTLGEAATIESLWTIRRGRGDAVTGRSVARETIGGDSYDAMVAAHSRALAAISREIGEAIRAMDTGSPMKSSLEQRASVDGRPKP